MIVDAGEDRQNRTKAAELQHQPQDLRTRSRNTACNPDCEPVHMIGV
jgi:hypothetical protein